MCRARIKSFLVPRSLTLLSLARDLTLNMKLHWELTCASLFLTFTLLLYNLPSSEYRVTAYDRVACVCPLQYLTGPHPYSA